MIGRTWAVLAAVLVTAAVVRADVALQATINGPIHVGETAELSVTATGASSIPAPSIGGVDGLQIRYVGPEKNEPEPQLLPVLEVLHAVDPLSSWSRAGSPFWREAVAMASPEMTETATGTS